MFAELASVMVGLSDHELDERIRELELLRRRTESELAAAIAVADARQLNAADGHRSMTGYLRATCDWAPGEIGRFRATASLCDRHGEIGDAWHAGAIGSAHVAAIASTHRKVRAFPDASERFGEFVPGFVEHAETLPLADFETVLDRFVQLATADGSIDERAAVDGRRATATHANGELVLNASGGDATSTAEFLAILRRFENDEFRKDVESRDAAIGAGRDPEPFRTGPQRRFDALVAMARSAAESSGHVSTSEPLVSILVDHVTMGWVLAHSGLGSATSLTGTSIDPFTGLPVADGAFDDLLGDPADLLDRRCETADGVPLRPADVLRALLSGRTRRVVLGAHRRVVDLGRSNRLFTGAARDAALLLTTSCEHPGCTMPAEWCQVDHSTEWHDDGATDQDNAGTRCAAHNREKHRARRSTRRSVDGRNHTLRPDGTVLLPVGCRPPRFEPDDDDDIDDDPITPEEEQAMIDAARARLMLAALPH